jgi:hypothetical protein
MSLWPRRDCASLPGGIAVPIRESGRVRTGLQREAFAAERTALSAIDSVRPD